MNNERPNVPDYLKLADEALASMRSTKCEKSHLGPAKKPCEKADTPALCSPNSLLPHPASPSHGVSPFTYIKNKNNNNINDGDVIDEVVEEIGCEAKSEGEKLSDERGELGEQRAFQHAFENLIARPPASVNNQRWVQAIIDAESFLAAWSKQAAAFGWTAEELFGLHPVSPLRRYDVMGLIWLLQGCPVVVLTELTAVIKTSAGNELTFYRRDVEFPWRRCGSGEDKNEARR